MNALFAHSLKFLEDEDGQLYVRGYNKEYWTRYLKHFDNLYVIGRKFRIKKQKTKGYDKFEGSGLHFVEVPEIHSPFKGVFNLKRLQTIMDSLIQSIDFVIARIPGTYSSTAVKLCKKYNKPYLIEVVGCPWDALWNHSIKGKLLAPYMTLSTKKIVKDAPYVIYVTNRFLQNRYPTRGISTNCSNVTLPSIDNNILERRIRKIKMLEEGQRVIIGTTAAIDVRYKGQQYVIEALGRLKKQGITNIEYQLVGGGSITYLQSVAQKHDVLDQVKFLGSYTHEMVFEWLDSIDLYVQPSKQEGLPRALIEAMSRAVPCFGANIGGIPELIEQEFIFSTSTNFPDQICKIILRMNHETMIEQAKRNFIEAKKYGSDIIESRREQFIVQTLSNILG